jgi:hypothetical protein
MFSGEYGGEFSFCDECVTTYCIPCSVKAEKPIRSHEYDNCEDARNGISNEAANHVKHIQEEIFNLRCPRCSAAFFEFDGCAAVVCGSCRCGFCGLCLQDCGNDAHEHVRQCPKNPEKNNYFVSDAGLSKAHREMRITKLKLYIEEIREKAAAETPQIVESAGDAELPIVESVLRTIRRDLIDHGICERDIK